MAKKCVFVNITPLVILAAILVAPPHVANALIIDGDYLSATNPALYTTAPADNPGWANIGVRGSIGTGIYLGNGWVLTANHVGAGSITLGATTYSYDNTVTPIHLNNPSPASGQADLLLYKIVGDPGLPTLTIRSTSPTTGSTITMIGTGNTRGSARQSAVISVAPSETLNYYLWGSSATRAKTWGTNTIDSASFLYSYNNTYSYVVDFDNITGEAQAIDHDSGGGVFVKNASNQWELTGVMLAVTAYDISGTNAAGYTNRNHNTQTYIADLSYYADQINQYVIPEPASLGLIAVGGLALLSRRNRRDA